MTHDQPPEEGARSFQVSLETAKPVEGFSGGVIANHVMVSTAENLFILDFLRVVPTPSPNGLVPDATLVERVFLSPHIMKGLVDAIQNVIADYERRWSISLPNLKQIEQKRE